MWILVSDQPHRGLGPSLLWALKENATELHVLADSHTDVLARQALHFAFPITVWNVDDRTLTLAQPGPHIESPPAIREHLDFVEIITSGGAVAHIEHGIVTGEVLGLEVCRAVTDQYSGEHRLEVGIGAHDREAFALLHGNKPRIEALSDVVESVRKQRRPGAEPHPFNRLAPERLLRARVVASPQLIGAKLVTPCDPPFPRTNVLDVVPCVATASLLSGKEVVVVFTAGADPDIVPFALDARHRINSHAELIVAMPDTHITRTNRIALELAIEPAQFMGIKPVGIDGELAFRL